MRLSPYVKTFNSKVIKRFRTWTKKSLRVLDFRDSYVLSLWTLHVYFAHGINCGYVTLFTNSLWENNWIHTFPTGISDMRNINSLFQNLNAGRRVHFFYESNHFSTNVIAGTFHCSRLFYSLLGGYRIHQPYLYRKVRLPQRVYWYDNKQSDGEAPVMQELWGI